MAGEEGEMYSWAMAGEAVEVVGKQVVVDNV